MNVTVRTNLTPEVSIDFDGSKRENPLTELFLRILQPSITIWGYSYVPYGSPGMLGGAVFLVILGIFAFGLYKLLF